MQILIILQYSMRDYKTGEYQLISDGHMNSTLHRISWLGYDDHVTITIPTNRNKEHMKDILRMMETFRCSITLMSLDYGEHAGENRKILREKVSHIDFSHYDVVESHVCNIDSKHPINYFIDNSSILEYRRPYADAHFLDLLHMLQKPNTARLNLATDSQLRIIPMCLRAKVEVDMKFFNPKLADAMMDMYFDEELMTRLSRIIPKEALFFPFRLSDPVYRFDLASQEGVLVVTDPNSSLSGSDHAIININDEHPNKKVLFMTMLYLIKHERPDIRIPLYEDINVNFHMGIVELVYYLPSTAIKHFKFGNIHNKFIVHDQSQSDKIADKQLRYINPKL